MHNLFQIMLRNGYSQLPEVVRNFHEARLGHFDGEVEVSGGAGWGATFLRKLAGLPDPMPRAPAVVKVLRTEVQERLLRQFGPSQFASRLSRVNKQNLLREEFGLFTFYFTLSAGQQRIHWRCVSWSLAGIPMPDSLAPDVDAWEGADEQGRYLFHVAIDMPMVGRLLAYEGWLTIVTAKTAASG